MENFLSNWLILAGVMAVGLASPGPDFIMTVRNSITHSRRAGILTALGLALGVGIHVTYCLTGLAVVISKSILLFNTLKYVGAAYLLYIGVKALRSKGFQPQEEPAEVKTNLSDFAALRSGFITNLFNPKATMFFLAVFTQVVDPHVDFKIQVVYGVTCIVMTGLWFSFVATVLTTPAIRARFLGAAKWIDRVCGALFIGLAARLALSKN